MSFHDDCTDRDFRSDLSPDQLERLERLEQHAAPLETEINPPGIGHGVVRRTPAAAPPPTAFAAVARRLAASNQKTLTDPATADDDPITPED